MLSNTEKVLGIPELLEAILLKLPNADVLHSQAVCKKWQATITETVTIQQKLFYKPVSDDRKPVVNPFLKFILQREQIGSRVDGIKHQETCKDDVPPTGNGCNVPACEHPFHLHIAYSDSWLGGNEPVSSYHVRLEAGSWRHMLITSPSCPIHFMKIGNNERDFEYSASTVGQLVDDINRCRGQEEHEFGPGGIFHISDAAPESDDVDKPADDAGDEVRTSDDEGRTDTSSDSESVGSWESEWDGETTYQGWD